MANWDGRERDTLIGMSPTSRARPQLDHVSRSRVGFQRTANIVAQTSIATPRSVAMQ